MMRRDVCTHNPYRPLREVIDVHYHRLSSPPKHEVLETKRLHSSAAKVQDSLRFHGDTVSAVNPYLETEPFPRETYNHPDAHGCYFMVTKFSKNLDRRAITMLLFGVDLCSPDLRLMVKILRPFFDTNRWVAGVRIAVEKQGRSDLEQDEQLKACGGDRVFRDHVSINTLCASIAVRIVYNPTHHLPRQADLETASAQFQECIRAHAQDQAPITSTATAGATESTTTTTGGGLPNVHSGLSAVICSDPNCGDSKAPQCGDPNHHRMWTAKSVKVALATGKPWAGKWKEA